MVIEFFYIILASIFAQSALCFNYDFFLDAKELDNIMKKSGFFFLLQH